MKSQWSLVTALTLALLASLGVPDLVAAEHRKDQGEDQGEDQREERRGKQKADPNAVLYEVTESLSLAPLQLGQRVASAVLSGTVAAGTSVCPAEIAAAWSVKYCVLTAKATDNINIKTGKGPVEGRFRVLIQGDNPVDAPELVIIEGKLQGQIDLSPALLGKAPLGTLEKGRWRARGVIGGPVEGLDVEGTLTGTFRLPFVVGFPEGCETNGSCLSFSKPLYLTDRGPVKVAPNEYSLGVPTVKLEITFRDKD